MSPTVRHLQERRTLELLEDGDPLAVIACGRDAIESYDALVADHLLALRQASKLACSAGCSACCSLEVSATFPEMAQVAAHVGEHFSDVEIAALRLRMDARSEAVGGMSGQERASGSRACVLLVDQRCSIYEARPLACRGWNAAESAPCFIALEFPEAPPSIAVDARLRGTALEVARGLSDGAREQGLDDAPLDLARSLRELLGHEDEWSRRWLRGEMLPDGMKSPSVPSRQLGEDGRWRFHEEPVMPVPVEHGAEPTG